MAQVRFDNHGLTFRERRRFRVWGMDKTIPVEPRDVFEKASGGRLEVSGPQFDSPMPVLDQEDLAELAFFCTGQGTVADLPTAQALMTLQDLGWTFQQGDRKIGAYGVYNRLGEEGLVAVRGHVEEPLSGAESLQVWAGATGSNLVAEKAGWSAYLLTQDVADAEVLQRLVDEGRYAAASSLLPAQNEAEELPPKIRALSALALQKHPQDLGTAAKELFSHELNAWEKEKVGDLLLRMAPPDQPVTRLMRDLWSAVPVSEARGLLAEAVWPHLGAESRGQLRKVGTEAMASVGSYYVQRAMIGRTFSEHVGSSRSRWVLDLADKVFAHESKSSLYRACLADESLPDARVFADALEEITYNEDGAIVGRAALGRLQAESVNLAREMIDDRTYSTYVQALALAAVRCTESRGEGAVQAFAHEGLKALVGAELRDYHLEIAFSKKMSGKLADSDLGKICAELAALKPSSYERPGPMLRDLFGGPLNAPIDAKFVRGLAKHYPGSSGRPVLEALSTRVERIKKCLVAGARVTDLEGLAVALELTQNPESGAIDVDQGLDHVQVGDFDLEVKQ